MGNYLTHLIKNKISCDLLISQKGGCILYRMSSLFCSCIKFIRLQLKLHEAPIFMHFGPKGKPKKADTMDIHRLVWQSNFFVMYTDIIIGGYIQLVHIH